LICDAVNREAGPNRLPAFCGGEVMHDDEREYHAAAALSTLAIALSPSMKFGAALS
jgi:hypothetical protein